MKLAVKFNLVFVAVFGLGFSATGYVAHRFLLTGARDEVVQQARLMMETGAATRTYTSERVRPILERVHQEQNVFYPESVPAFSAIKVLTYLRKSFPDYTYREAALNPTNPSDRALDWEADILSMFRNDSSKKEFIGERDTPTGRMLYLAKPMRVAAACLACHSTAGDAPPSMVALYGPNNGFGWKLDDVVAAQIVTVPMSTPARLADRAFGTLMLWLGGVSIASLVLLNLALVIAVVRPVASLSATADEISKGNLDVPELPVKGKDEVSLLADSFNRMHRSLVKALKMLEE